jgi:hypothetical protein
MAEGVPAKSFFQFPIFEPLVADTSARLLAPNTASLHRYAGWQRPSLPAGDT